MSSFDDLWSSLPVPALIIAADDKIEEVNPAAEAFLNLSRKSLLNSPVWDRVMVDAPMDAALARARSDGVPLFV
ncbi:MAG: PAS domain-containing protein, partial [Pseudomonadota bacterium]